MTIARVVWGALVVCTSLLTSATPIQQPQPSARTAVQTPSAAPTSQPITVVVQEPNQLPVIVVGVLTLIVLVFQVRIMSRQDETMRKQTTIFDRQTSLLEQQAAWRRDEAIGTFYRLAHDLVSELRKADVLPRVKVPADYNTHPRQMLREASRLFAPLGNAFVLAANVIGQRLDEYFSAVDAFNNQGLSRRDGELWQSVQTMREVLGQDLDNANREIRSDLRWKYSDGKDYDFRSLCSMPPDFLEAGKIETSTPPSRTGAP